MGMDLVPRHNIRGFHANWTGWSEIQVLLSFLEQDLTHMGGDNSGNRVPAADARAWGKAVRTALEKKELIEAKVSCEGISGGWKTWTIPQSKKSLFDEAYKRIAGGEKAQTLLERYFQMDGIWDKAFKDRGDKKRQVPKDDEGFIKYDKLDKEGEEFFLEFATFCEKSGGFQQC